MSASTSGYEAPGSWSWPDDLHSSGAPQQSANPSSSRSTQVPPGDGTARHAQEQNGTKQPPPRNYKPRTCRICLDTVLPTTQTPSQDLPSVFAGRPHVVYESPKGDGGRLISPCRCKGSQKYVHEECLQSWRHADPSYGHRHFWECPTCKYKYRLQRMTWGRYISGTVAQLSLTLVIFILTIFMLGFVADPIINLYVDPYNTLSNPSKYAFDDSIILDDEPTWAEHFVKGFASVGLLGLVKVLIGMSPWQWFNFRGYGIARGRGGGRDRLAGLNWFLVLLGVFSFLYAVYKGISAWSRRILKDASERVIDVGNDDDDDDE